MKKIFLFIVCFLSAVICFAQDIHFSQFYESPLTLNPALAASGVDMRANLNYKNQWGSIAAPYRTVAGSYEKALLKKKWENGYLGAGISAFSDKAGNSKMANTQLNFSLSSVRKLNEKNNLSLGLQGGFSQRSFNTSDLHWDNQFTGSGYDPSLSSGEVFSSSKAAYGDFGAGILWSYGKGEMYSTANDQLKANVGFSAFHLNRPAFSFYGTNAKLDTRYVLHGQAAIGIKNTNFSLVPGFMFANQGTQQELILGTLVKCRLKEDSKYTGYVKGSAIAFGAYYRTKDSFIITGLLEISSYAIGISYDVNSSALKAASSGRGGLEISLRFASPNPFGGPGDGSTPSFNKH